MVIRMTLQLIIIVTVNYSKIFTNGIMCFCTTDDCVRQRRTVCEAPTSCFREYLQESIETPIKFHATGCISEANPLMCDQNLSFPTGNGPKLYLECCYERYCNVKTKPNMEKFSLFLELVQIRTNEALKQQSRMNRVMRTLNPRQGQLMINNLRFKYPLSIIIIVSAICGVVLIIILIFTIVKLVLVYNVGGSSTGCIGNDQIYSVSLSGSSSDHSDNCCHLSTINSKKMILYSTDSNISTFYRKIVDFFKSNHRQTRVILA